MSSMPSSQVRTFQSRGHVRAAANALWAIVGRDVLILRREVVVFLVQTLMQPLFLLFVLGKVFPTIGAAPAGFATVLLPGIVALTIIITGVQGPSIDLARDLAVTREIEDRLLAPLPVSLVLTEKFALAVVRALIGGALVFPLAFWMLGNGVEMRTDRLILLILLMALIALAGVSLGLLIAVVAPVQLLPVIFALVFTPLVFTGCALYSWSSLDKIRWFQVITLFNPITYAAEGLRYAMIPPIHGQASPTLAIGWILLALGACTVTCLVVAIRLFYRRVIG